MYFPSSKRYCNRLKKRKYKSNIQLFLRFINYEILEKMFAISPMTYFKSSLFFARQNNYARTMPIVLNRYLLESPNRLTISHATKDPKAPVQFVADHIHACREAH